MAREDNNSLSLTCAKFFVQLINTTALFFQTNFNPGQMLNKLYLWMICLIDFDVDTTLGLANDMAKKTRVEVDVMGELEKVSFLANFLGLPI